MRSDGCSELANPALGICEISFWLSVESSINEFVVETVLTDFVACLRPCLKSKEDAITVSNGGKRMKEGDTGEGGFRRTMRPLRFGTARNSTFPAASLLGRSPTHSNG